jgi:hypothetical protein
MHRTSFETLPRRRRGCCAFVRQPARKNSFWKWGVPVPTRTSAPPQLDEAAQAAFIAKVQALGPKYRTEMLQKA